MADVVQRDYLALEQKLWDAIADADGLHARTAHPGSLRLWELLRTARAIFSKDAKALGYEMPDRKQ